MCVAQETTTRLRTLGISVVLNQYGAAGGSTGNGAVIPLGLAATGALYPPVGYAAVGYAAPVPVGTRLYGCLHGAPSSTGSGVSSHGSGDVPVVRGIVGVIDVEV
jgi:hypothetical protein